MPDLQPAIFLDLDEVLSPPRRGAAHAVGMLRRAGYLCVVVSEDAGGVPALRERLGGFDAACTRADLRRTAEEIGIDLRASWHVSGRTRPADSAGCRHLQVPPLDCALLDAAQAIIAPPRPR